MDKLNVLGEIKGFLEGYNDDLKYLVNVETDSRTNVAKCVIHEPNKEKKIIDVRYEPFMYMKDLSKTGHKFYDGYSDERFKSMQNLFGVTITKLKTGNQQRLTDGYCYKLTSNKSYKHILDFIKNGGINPYEKAKDERGKFLKKNNGDFVYPNRDLFHTLKTTDQFFISTKSRLFKGLEEYKDVHRITFDIETTGLRYQISRMFAIGVKDNRDLNIVLEVDKIDDDESEIRLIQDFFNLIELKRPAIIAGYNSENFDFDYILGRAEILGMDINALPVGLNPKAKLRRKGNTSVKYGNNADKYTATEMWGYSIIDIMHAAKKTAAMNTEIKSVGLKNIAKYEKIAKPNRTYIKGEDNSIGKFYSENKVFLVNESNNEYIQIPDEFQETGRKMYKLQANKKILSDEKHLEFKKKYLSADKEFVEWFRKEALPNKKITFISGKILLRQYLLDDLWETEQVDELYNQSSFMLAKIVPTNFHRVCTMGTASIWNLLLTAWSYENDLAVPIPDTYEHFSGGLARTFKKGYSERIIKIDYASLYPMIQLTDRVFPMFDITAVMEKMLLYMTTTRNIYKKLAAYLELNEEEIKLLAEIDHEAYIKFKEGTLTPEDRAKFKVKQLPIKILNNSLFGALGSHISFNWSDNICAGRITCVARIQLRHAIKWFNDYGCIPLLAVTDGVNFQIPELSNIRVRDDKTVIEENERPIDEMWQYKGETGIQALIEKFNEEEMPKPYMAVDDDGEFISCLNLARINYALLSEYKDKKTGEMKEKIKLTGNTIKSKTMSEYIEEFLDNGFDLILHGKGKEFVDYYHKYVEDIRYMQIPLKKIASKSKVKQTLTAYKHRGKDKNGREKGMQAHMELLIQQREKQAVELFEKHKGDIGFNADDSELSPDDKMKLIINYMPPEPELDSTVYYINTGYVKSHGDSKMIKDKETGEMRFASALISAEDLLENPNMTGTYNYEKYLDAFNSRVGYTSKKIGSLISGFDPEIAEKILIRTEKKGKNKGDLIKELFTSDQLQLKNYDLDSVDESLHLEHVEVDFWNKSGYDPRKVWDGFKMYDDYKVHYEVYDNALKFLNEKMIKLKKPSIKSINDDYTKGDLVLIKKGSAYHVGAYNGIFMEIVRSDIEIPKSDIEIELDKKYIKNDENIEELKEIKTVEIDNVLPDVEVEKPYVYDYDKFYNEFVEAFNIPKEYDTFDKLKVAMGDEVIKTIEMYIDKVEKANEPDNSDFEVDYGI